ncbi:hypothetical protein HDU91_005164, partial [Kappamyces sp. JEL0680]
MTAHTMVATESGKPKDMEWNAFSYVSVSWLNQTLKKGAMSPLQPHDLLAPHKHNKAEYLSTRFAHFWHGRTRADLRRVLWSIGGWPFVLIMVWEACFLAIRIWLLPLFLGQLIAYLDGERSHLLVKNGYGLAVLMGGLQAAQTLVSNLLFITQANLSQNLQISLQEAIYVKSFRLSPAARTKFSEGKIISLINEDVAGFAAGVVLLNDLWTVPVSLGLSIYFLTRLIGVAVWPSLGLAFSSLALAFVSGSYFGILFGALFATIDSRITTTREIFGAIKTIKYLALEDYAEQKIM